MTKQQAGDILIVEDSPDLVVLLSHLLKSEGFRVHVVSSGTEAIAAMEDIHPALVLLDVMLPGIDGWEVCRRIRSHVSEGLAATPVVMLTVFSTAAHRIKAAGLGANEFIGKPFGLREVVTTIRRVLDAAREGEPGALPAT